LSLFFRIHETQEPAQHEVLGSQRRVGFQFINPVPRLRLALYQPLLDSFDGVVNGIAFVSHALDRTLSWIVPALDRRSGQKDAGIAADKPEEPVGLLPSLPLNALRRHRQNFLGPVGQEAQQPLHDVLGSSVSRNVRLMASEEGQGGRMQGPVYSKRTTECQAQGLHNWRLLFP